METAVLAERLSALDSRGDSARGGGSERGCEPGDLAELVAITQRLNTLIAIETAGLDATGGLTAGGYRSPAGFLAGDGGRLGRGTARRFLSCGRVLGQFPVLAAAAVAGEVTFDHVATFARLLPASASEHRRVCLVRDEAELVAAARVESVTAFSGRCVSWRHLVDPDDRLEERLGREEHGMSVSELGAGSSELTLRGTTAEIEQLRAAINRLADEAWRAQRNEDTDKAEAGGESDEPSDPAGDAVGGSDVASDLAQDVGNGGSAGRSERAGDAASRRPLEDPDSTQDAGDGGWTECTDPVRVDGCEGSVGVEEQAVAAGGGSRVRCHPVRGRLVARAAAELASRAVAGGGSGGGRPVVVVVMDWVTFTAEAERFATGAGPEVDVFAPGFRSETIDGHPIPPGQGFWLALQGEVQRCVIGADSLRVDLGRQQRLFNPAGRRAVQVRDRTCVHAACDLPATWADIDHIIDWARDGATDTVNAQALCRWHHLQKHQRPTTGPDDRGVAA